MVVEPLRRDDDTVFVIEKAVDEVPIASKAEVIPERSRLDWKRLLELTAFVAVSLAAILITCDDSVRVFRSRQAEAAASQLSAAIQVASKKLAMADSINASRRIALVTKDSQQACMANLVAFNYWD